MKVLYLIDGLSAGGGAERSLLELAPGCATPASTCPSPTSRSGRRARRRRLRALGVPVAPHRRSRGRAAAGPSRAPAAPVGRFDIVHTTLFEADVLGRLAAVGTPVKVISSYVNTALRPRPGPQPRSRGVEAADRSRRPTASPPATSWTLAHANSESVKESIVRHLRVPPDRVRVVLRSRSPTGCRARIRRGDAAVRAALGIDADDAGARSPSAATSRRRTRCRLVRAMLDVRARADPTPCCWSPARRARRPRRSPPTIDELGLAEPCGSSATATTSPDLLQAADVFVLPTLFEGLPGAVIEAMAMGTPIVASDIGPVRELVDETIGAGSCRRRTRRRWPRPSSASSPTRPPRPSAPSGARALPRRVHRRAGSWPGWSPCIARRCAG